MRLAPSILHESAIRPVHVWPLEPDCMKGIVVSDLHMFARRSRAHEVLDRVHRAVAEADVLVLNGDTFDFRWTTLPTIDGTVQAALSWLESLAERHPETTIHFVLGNHDCNQLFINGLDALSKRIPSLHWHEYQIHLGSNLFLHGDCADYKMTAERLAANRRMWQFETRKSDWMGVAYECADRIGVTSAVPRVLCQRERVAKRILHYLHDAVPHVMPGIEDVYFGHTHLPFVDYHHRGIRFHNTGCAVGSLEFNMLDFRVDGALARATVAA